ncbi:MAG: dihydroorotate dehydrogenase (quinone) [Gammaproteobacteria bacterium]|nr:MAG: dihydroorotate dehydrogenase (quinone) [Gammaproteobacteria bacterium]
MFYQAFRPFLFALDAEKAHCLSLAVLDRTSRFVPAPDLSSSPTEVMGITFPNKIGLAAGLDKNGEHIDALGKFGFGFIEVGTVTPRPQTGNPKPRLFRLVRQQAIINRMGFNNKGVDNLVAHVQRVNYSGVLGINIGKNKDTPNNRAADDYLYCLKRVYQYADYIVVNISSPNTVGLRDLQNDDSMVALIDALKMEQDKLTKRFGYKPIAVKIAPDLTDEAVIGLAGIFKSYGVDGIIATNTTINKTSVKSHLNGGEEGGLSGKPLTRQSTHIIRLLADELSGKVPIIGVGGIMTTADAREKLAAGASLIQVYTGLIYKGPQLVRDILAATGS